MTVSIVGITGSLRRESHNRKLLRAAAHELPTGVDFRVWDGVAAIQPFDEDHEHDPAAAVTEFRRAIAAADAVLFATPEYNGSIPGQLKNAVDWASRPYGEGVLTGKPVAVIGASPSPHGAAWAQAELRKVLGIAGAVVVDADLPVPEAHRQIDENGRLIDRELTARLRDILDRLYTLIDANRTAA